MAFQAIALFLADFGPLNNHPPSTVTGWLPAVAAGGGVMPQPDPHGMFGASLGWRARMLTVSLICMEAMPFRNAARGSGKLRLVHLSTFSMLSMRFSAVRPAWLLNITFPPRRMSGLSTTSAPPP